MALILSLTNYPRQRTICHTTTPDMERGFLELEYRYGRIFALGIVHKAPNMVKGGNLPFKSNESRVRKDTSNHNSVPVESLLGKQVEVLLPLGAYKA